jgi:hypothetical protein
MTVTVRYIGGFGNNLFQYACARLFAMENDLRLVTPFNHEDVLPMTAFEGGELITTPAIQIGEGWTPLAHPYSKNSYEFLGFFQKTSWYVPRRAKIESFARPRPRERNTRDIVMHVRLGDFKQCRIAIHPSWYTDILSREWQPGRKVYIVTDEPDPSYLSWFRKYEPEIVCTNKVHDWEFLRSFDTVIGSNSTFCWWAVFFSRPKRLYTFKRWIDNQTMEMDALEEKVIVDGAFLHERPL